MSGLCVILTTTDSEELAHAIADTLVHTDLAVCVHIDQIVSIFKWEGAVNKDNEYRLLIKAASDKYQQIEQKIVDMHTYTVPQIVKWEIDDGLPAYLQWAGILLT